MSVWPAIKKSLQREDRKRKKPRKRLSFFFVLTVIFFVFSIMWPLQSYAIKNGDTPVSAQENAYTTASVLQEFADFSTENGSWASIKAGFTTVMTTFQTLMKKFWDFHGQSTVGKLTAQRLQATITTEAWQAALDASTENAVLEEKMKHLADHIMPPASEQFLCNLILARQGVPVMTEFARIISKVVAKGIDARSRSRGSDGNGPQYAMDAWNIKCGKYGADRPKTGNAIDGVPKACRAEETAPAIGYAGGDVSMDTLSREKVYTVPPVKEETMMINGKMETVADFFPDKNSKDYEAHRQWLMARQYCYNLAGPRLTPPRDEDLDTPAGKANFTLFTSCLSRQSAFVKACTDRLGKLTRPDCSTDDFKEFCDASIQACDAARESQIVLPPEFNNCQSGLSLYQAEYLSNALCGSTRRLQADTHGGEQDHKKVSTLLMCQIMREVSEKRQQEEDKAFVRAVQGMQNMKGCWD